MPPKNLPTGAQKIYLAAEENAKKTTCKDAGERQDECAARVAWSAVKRKYKKSGDTWIPKAEVQEFSMAIVKASYDKATATRRWRAVASDTEEDSYKDNMSLQLFNDFLHRIETSELPPEDFRSDFWNGGKPYLSVSHYPDLNGKGVPGPVDTVYIDGNRLKATGRFDNTPIGRACFESICRDLYNEDGPVPDDERIRISIAFLDYKHRHKATDYVFERSEEQKLCPDCLREIIENDHQGKEFLQGHLIHLGMTRVPVNKRTDMEVERSMTTMKEDAASIIGEELAEELEEEKNKVVGKSEALVIKSEEEEPEAEITEEEELPEEVVEEAKHKKEMDEEYEDEEEAEEEKKKKKEPKAQKAELSSDAQSVLDEIIREIKSNIVEKPHPLDGVFAELKSVYDQVIDYEDVQVALQEIQEPFENLGKAIQENFVREEPTPEPEELSIAQVLSEFRKEMELLRSEIAASKTQVQMPSLVPERRSLKPELVLEPTEPQSKTPNLRSVINKSVGLQ